MFTPFDPETWPRREHFDYYRNLLPCGYNLTVRLDMTRFLAAQKQAQLRFYPSFIHCVAAVVAELPEFCMGLQDGAPGYYDCMHPVYTVFHEDDKTFSDLWSEYDPHFPTFYRRMLADQETYGHIHRMKPKPGPMPPNFFCISGVPWLDFSGYATYTTGDRTPNLFPVISFGKYRQVGERWEMPLNLNIAHASADGYHSALFFNRLQARLDSIVLPSADDLR